MMRRELLILVGAVLAVGSLPSSALGVTATEVASGLSLPIYATGALRGDPLAVSPSYARDPRLFILERSGVIRILDEGALRPTAFLDIDSKVGTAGEGGLLGLAFDLEHPQSGLFYVYYTNNSGDSVLSRFRVGADPNVALPGEEILLVVDQPFNNHNGGTIAFSPVDGFLYWALGDGGSANDPADRAQDPDELLGKMLRVDVGGGPGSGYTVPPSNPWTLANDPLEEVLDEIWAFGLRNPFRWAFDSKTGDAWVADVGQSLREEVNFEAAGDGGHNYGWDDREGDGSNPSGSSTPVYGLPLTDPVISYDHLGGFCNTGGSGTITGGTVYRGSEAGIQGEYFYADYCTAAIDSYDPVSQITTDQRPDLGIPPDINQIVAIGEGGFGALYIVRIGSGTVHRVGPSGSECNDGIDNDGDGATDAAADTGCVDAADSSELDMDTPCDDGYDNDSDGDIDYPDDAGCASATGTSELPAFEIPSLSVAGYATLVTLLALAAGLALRERRSRH